VVAFEGRTNSTVAGEGDLSAGPKTENNGNKKGLTSKEVGPRPAKKGILHRWKTGRRSVRQFPGGGERASNRGGGLSQAKPGGKIRRKKKGFLQVKRKKKVNELSPKKGEGRLAKTPWRKGGGGESLPNRKKEERE